MATVIKGPSRYIQGAGELKNLGVHVKKIGAHFFILCSEGTRQRIGDQLRESLESVEKQVTFCTFRGQCSKEEIARVTEECRAAGCDIVVGAGGGKVIDTAKAVADGLCLPAVIIPTIASNDAPCSGISVIYNDEGVVVKALFTKRNPDVVLVDTEVIAQAPARLFAAGIGDALATWFEARAVKNAGAKTMARGTCSETALMMARLCYDILLRDGAQAYSDIRRHAVTPAVESVVEATIYLSGVGFESGGLAAAHAVNDGLVHLRGAHGMYHGEKVAFGTLVQLILEKAPQEELEKVLAFMRSVDLPVSFAGLGAGDADEQQLRAAAEAACVPTQSTKNLSPQITPDDVLAAMREADRLGSR